MSFLNAPTPSSIISFCRSEKPHVPEFENDKAQLEAVRNFRCQLSKKLPVDFDYSNDELVQDVKFSRNLKVIWGRWCSWKEKT